MYISRLHLSYTLNSSARMAAASICMAACPLLLFIGCASIPSEHRGNYIMIDKQGDPIGQIENEVSNLSQQQYETSYVKPIIDGIETLVSG